MKKILTLTMFCVVILNGFVFPNAQRSLYVVSLYDSNTWSKTFSYSFLSWDEGTGVQQTSDGGYIVVGYTDSMVLMVFGLSN